MSRKIANDAAVGDTDSRTPEEIRADYGRGADLARAALIDAMPVQETDEEKNARQSAEAAAIAEATRKSWEEIEKTIK